MKIIKRGINAVIPFLLANIYLLARCPGWDIPLMPLIVVVLIAGYVLLTAMPLLGLKNIQSKGIRRCQRGCENLYSFLAATVMSVILLILILVHVIDARAWTWKNWVLYILTAVAVLAVTFWVGIIRIYMSSRQLGIKWRVIGILCGWIPVVHLIVLGKLISLASGEAVLENEKLIKDKARQADRVCATRYPILMVHGVFFRDFRYLNYWGRIPAALEANGATIFYGNHQSAASVADSGREIADRIQQIVKETGCGKVNIIAHSKGGLDSRYAADARGAARPSRCRSPTSTSAAGTAAEHIADNEEEPTMKKTVTIEGMMCAHCVAHVEKALTALPGVKATVDLTSGTAVVEGDVTDEAIRAAVTDAGYTVKGIQ